MSPASEKFLAGIKSDDPAVRYATWSRAAEAEAEVVPALGRLLVRKAAGEALSRVVHSVGKAPGGTKREAVIAGLLALTAPAGPAWTRTVALRRLSEIGGDETVAKVAPLLGDAELREEAVFCLERIPGKASTAALIAAYKNSRDDFKPRLLAALGHRRAEEAVELCAGALRHSDTAIALAAFKALGRIGKKPAADVKPPDINSLPDFQKLEFVDSALRLAEGLARDGNTKDAVRIYRDILKAPEEHLQCAAIAGLAKTATAEAAALIFTRLKSDNSKVRITAQKAWKSMA
jgi:HEAT repeat protein